MDLITGLPNKSFVKPRILGKKTRSEPITDPSGKVIVVTRLSIIPGLINDGQGSGLSVLNNTWSRRNSNNLQKDYLFFIRTANVFVIFCANIMHSQYQTDILSEFF